VDSQSKCEKNFMIHQQKLVKEGNSMISSSQRTVHLKKLILIFNKFVYLVFII
jgi:hypothetical protein